MSGRFLVLEGIDGCGKSTQIEALHAWLPASGLMAPGARLVVTREPGGTALGQALRSLLLRPPEAAAPCSLSELMLYAADRAQHVEKCLRPALAAGDWVLCDRFSGSTAAYQGYGRGLPCQRSSSSRPWPPVVWRPISPSGSTCPWPAPAAPRRSARRPDRGRRRGLPAAGQRWLRHPGRPEGLAAGRGRRAHRGGHGALPRPDQGTPGRPRGHGHG